jgi:hypothetical protein
MGYIRDRRSFWSLCLMTAILGTALGLASSAQAQDLSALAGLGSSLTNGVSFTPQIQVGYQRLGLSFNLPASTDIGLSMWPSTLDLQLRKADLWVGSLGAVVDFPSRVSFSLTCQANAKKNAEVYEKEDFGEGGGQGVTWTASRLQWWTIDGRLMYRFRPDFSVVAGLRREQLSFNLSDPTTDEGAPENRDESGSFFGLPYELHQRYSSSLTSKLWIPYMGLDIIGSQYKASLIASPLVSVDLDVPAALLYRFAVFFPFGSPVQLITAQQMQYRVLKPAVFVEGNFNYDISVSEAFTLGLWCNASWLHLRGKGEYNYQYWGQSPPSPPSTDSQEQQNTATYTRYMLGAGLSAVLSF